MEIKGELHINENATYVSFGPVMVDCSYFVCLGLRIGEDEEDSVCDSEDPFTNDPESKRAVEYENLARLCLQKNQYVKTTKCQSRNNAVYHQLYYRKEKNS